MRSLVNLLDLGMKRVLFAGSVPCHTNLCNLHQQASSVTVTSWGEGEGWVDGWMGGWVWSHVVMQTITQTKHDTEQFNLKLSGPKQVLSWGKYGDHWIMLRWIKWQKKNSWHDTYIHPLHDHAPGKVAVNHITLAATGGLQATTEKPPGADGRLEVATNGNWRLQAATESLQVATVGYRWQLEAINGNCMVTSGNWKLQAATGWLQVANAWLQVATRGFKQKPCGYK